MSIAATASPAAVAENRSKPSVVSPMLGLQIASQNHRNLIAGTAGIQHRWFGLELEIANGSATQDWRAATRLTAEVWKSDRFRLYGVGKAFIGERHQQLGDAALVEDGWGIAAGVGVGARLTDYSEFFGEWLVERRAFGAASETGVSLAAGLRFRQW